MGWGVSLKTQQGHYAEVPTHQEDGVVAVGGTQDAWMAVTYSYGPLFLSAGLDFSTLDKKTGAEAYPILKATIEKLGSTTPDSNYWKACPGNAGHALSVLMAWAESNPTAVFQIR